MNKIKWFTQRTTGLIFWPIAVLLFPFVLAKIGQLIGVWSTIDNAYPLKPMEFWIWMVISRAIYMAIWIILSYGLYEFGKSTGFFWFKKEEYDSTSDDVVDKSGTIVGIIVVVVMLEVIAEIAVRLSILSQPPYLL